jgi:hypothetical protein
MWFKLAAAYFKPSDPRRNMAISSRELVEEQLRPEQLSEAQRRAREWTRSAHNPRQCELPT